MCLIRVHLRKKNLRQRPQRHCIINGKRPGHGVGQLWAEFRPHPVEFQCMRCTRTWASRWKLLGRITNRNCAFTAPPRLAEIGALELHEIGRWCSVHRHCLLSTTGHGWYCFHDGKSFMKVRQPVLCSLLTQAGAANMPRQGMHTGKRFQAGNWQAFPGRELASVPGRDCKRAQAAHWQMFSGKEP